MARTETIKDSAYRPIAILTYEDNGDIKVQDWQSRMVDDGEFVVIDDFHAEDGVLPF